MRANYSLIIKEIQDIRGEIHELRADITRYKGFLGGVMWAIGALSAAISFITQWVKSHA